MVWGRWQGVLLRDEETHYPSSIYSQRPAAVGAEGQLYEVAVGWCWW